MLCPAIMLGLLAAAPAASTDAEAAFYVSPRGDDAWSGRMPAPNARRTDGPFATPHRARDAVRALLHTHRSPGPITIMFRGGTYVLAEPLSFRPEDSGTEASPVVYRNYPGEAPVLSGGRPLAGWVRDRDGYWSLDTSGLPAGPTQLFINGQRRPRARWPVDRLLRIAGEPPATSNWAANLDPSENTEIGKRAFRYQPGDIVEDWASRPAAEIVVLQFWMEARLRIAAIDAAQQSIVFTGASWRPLTWSFGYYAENVAEGLEAPGAWCVDDGKALRYHPLPGEEPAAVRAVAPVLEQLEIGRAHV